MDALNGGARGPGPAASFSRSSLGVWREIGFHRQMELLSVFSSPQQQACKSVITEHQHPLFWSWTGYINNESRHSLPRLHFEDLKFPFGGCGIQNQTRHLAEG